MKRELLSGDEAVMQGALEVGIDYASSYPGTPASEIGDLFAKLAKQHGFYFEWSVNEKAALEGAAGAAFCGLKALVSFKHYGLNVASDSLLPLVYLECPLVVVVADDPGCWSSVQTEQDSRWYAILGKLPLLEPSNAQEAKEMTKEAFRLAWKYKIPVLIRLTTRVCYSRSSCTINKVVKTKIKPKFKKKFKLGAEQTVERHRAVLQKLKHLSREAESSGLNRIENEKTTELGIITAGVSYEYVKEVLHELKLNLPLLKLGWSWPLPEQKIKAFLKPLRSVLVVEELDPWLEEQIRKISEKRVYGKELIPGTEELRPEHVLEALSTLIGKPLKQKSFDVPARLPLFCSGCPYRPAFYAIKKVLGKEKIFGGDIGCYMLAAYKPFEMQDWVVSMGASLGLGHGISKATKEKPIIFIGDSTFLHAGIPQLINSAWNKADVFVVILDNDTTAMTGHQPHPGSGYNALGQAKKIEIEDIVRACKADLVKVSNPYNFEQFCKDVKEGYGVKGTSVLIAKGPCRLLFIRQLAREGKNWPRFEIIKQKNELEELKEFGCPAIRKEKGKWLIDEKLCWGCSVCKQLFPECIRKKLT